MSENELNRIIAKNISKQLELHNMTQLDLAEYMNVSQATVSNWCKGLKMPRMSKIDMICYFFSIQRSDLLNDKDSKNSRHENNMNPIFELPSEFNIIIETMSSLEKEQTTRLIAYYLLLSDIGKKKALDNIEDLAKIYSENIDDQLAAAHNDHMDEDGEQEKVMRDLSKLKRPD